MNSQQTHKTAKRASDVRPRHRRPEALSPEIASLLAQSRNDFLRYLQRHLRNGDQAEEVLQDFYLRVVLKAGQIRDSASTMAWLRTVLKSVLADHFRRQAVERQAKQATIAEWLTLRPDLSDESDQVTCGCFYKLLPTLKAEYAEALHRVDLAQEPREDVAHSLGITAGNMRVRLHRARHALRQALERSCDQCRKNGCFHGQDMAPSNGEAGSTIGHSHPIDNCEPRLWIVQPAHCNASVVRSS